MFNDVDFVKQVINLFALQLLIHYDHSDLRTQQHCSINHWYIYLVTFLCCYFAKKKKTV